MEKIERSVQVGYRLLGDREEGRNVELVPFEDRKVGTVGIKGG